MKHAFGEILTDSWQIWLGGGWLLVALVQGALLLLLAERLLGQRIPEQGRRWLYGFLGLAAAGVGLVLASRMLWLGDDAHISFRYAWNFAEGHGLVFNPGEWVEGYTNFLWTLLLGVAAWFGADMRYVALFGNLAAYAGAVLLAAALVRKLAPSKPLVPFTAIALGGSLPFTTFASSGLETMPQALLVVAGMWASTLRRGALLAGAFLIAAVMTRPDHAVIYGAMGLALVAEDLVHHRGSLWARLQWKRYFAYAAPFVFVYVPYFLWRWSAYGDFFPNTYYAKSGGSTYYEQGLIYGLHFLVAGGGWAMLAALLFSLVDRPRSPDLTRLRVFAVVGVALFSHYVVRVGGDFMQWRFFVTLIPVALVTAEVGLRWQFEYGRSWLLRGAVGATACVALVGSLHHVNLIAPGQFRWHIAAEDTWYRVSSVFPLRIRSGFYHRGHELHRALTARGLSPRLATECVGMVAYYGQVPVVDMFGLTNKRIGKKEITARGRPGHEKVGTLEDILAEGAVLAYDTYDGNEFREESRVRIDRLKLYLVRWDPDFAAQTVGMEGVELPDPAADVRRIAAHGTRHRVVLARTFYERFLDRHPEREALLDLLDTRLRSVAEFEAQEVAEARGTGFQVELRTPWDDRARPAGVSGRGWLSSAGAPRGWWERDLGPIVHPELRFALGGPRSRGLRAELVVEGEVVLQAQPAGGGTLQPVRWDLAPWHGRPATLRFVDEDAGPDAVLLVDAVHWGTGDGDDLPVRLATTTEPAALAPLIWEGRQVLPDLELPQGWTLWSFDEGLPEGSSLEGRAFGSKGIARGHLSRQSPIEGQVGAGFLNSYHGLDRAKGRVELPEVELPETVFALVGGGDDCKKTYVGVMVGDRVVARACGVRDEVLRPVALDTSAWAGRRGRVVVVDRDDGPWGHVLADEILLPPPASAAEPAPAQVRAREAPSAVERRLVRGTKIVQ